MGCGASTSTPHADAGGPLVPAEALASSPAEPELWQNEAPAPLKAQTPVTRAPSGGRKLTAKSKPFWELEQERKAQQVSEPQTRQTTPVSCSTSDDEGDDVTLAASRALVARVISRVCADAAPPSPTAADVGEMCDRNGCGCGDAPPAEIEPSAWVESLESEHERVLEAAWLAKLSRGQFRVLRMKGTEAVDSGAYNNLFEDGTYCCAACARPLYDASHKMRTGHGWPAFFDSVEGALVRHEAKRKVEITCAGCAGHIGHVFFSKRYPKPHHERHCVNSIALVHVPPGCEAEGDAGMEVA